MELKYESPPITEQKPNDFVPIFRTELPNYSHLSAIEGFHAFFENKLPGSWLIRESRVPGMISVTFKKEDGKVAHTRFAFDGNKWIKVSDSMRNKHMEGSSILNYQFFDRANVKSKLELLFEAIYAPTSSFVFISEKMIEPVEEQVTRQKAYYIDVAGYVPVKQRTNEHVIYANLLQSLEKVQGAIKGCIYVLNAGQELINTEMGSLDTIQTSYSRTQLSHMLRNVSKPFQSNVKAQELKDLLESWLDANKLTFDLLCPVLHTLFEEPYYVVETGMVYDAAALFHDGKCLKACPLTRTEIENNPVHFEGYRRKLYETLELFFDLIQLHQAKLNLAQEKKEVSSNLSLFSIFTPADSGEASSALKTSSEGDAVVQIDNSQVLEAEANLTSTNTL